MLLHGQRQSGQRLLNFVLDLHLRDVGIRAALERDGDLAHAGRVRVGREVDETVDARELLFDDLGNARLESLGGGTWVAGADVDRRWRDVGILLDRQEEQPADAAEHDEDGNDPGQDRPVDERARNHRTESAMGAAAELTDTGAGSGAVCTSTGRTA